MTLVPDDRGAKRAQTGLEGMPHGFPVNHALEAAGGLEPEQSSLANSLSYVRQVSHGCSARREMYESPAGPVRVTTLSVSPYADFELRVDRRFDRYGIAVNPETNGIDRLATAGRFEHAVEDRNHFVFSGPRTFGLLAQQHANVPHQELVAFAPNAYGLVPGEFLVHNGRVFCLPGEHPGRGTRYMLAQQGGGWRLTKVDADHAAEQLRGVSLGFSLPLVYAEPELGLAHALAQDRPTVLARLGGEHARGPVQIAGLDRDGEAAIIFLDGGQEKYSVGPTFEEIQSVARQKELRVAGLCVTGPEVCLLIKSQAFVSGRQPDPFDYGNLPVLDFEDRRAKGDPTPYGFPAQLQIFAAPRAKPPA